MVPGEVRDEVVQDAPVPLVLLEPLREERRPREDRGPLAGGADGRCVRLQVLVVPQARARAAVLHERLHDRLVQRRILRPGVHGPRVLDGDSLLARELGPPRILGELRLDAY